MLKPVGSIGKYICFDGDLSIEDYFAKFAKLDFPVRRGDCPVYREKRAIPYCGFKYDQDVKEFRILSFLSFGLFCFWYTAFVH